MTDTTPETTTPLTPTVTNEAVVVAAEDADLSPVDVVAALDDLVAEIDKTNLPIGRFRELSGALAQAKELLAAFKPAETEETSEEG